ncbi:SgcJ/EcaC family oxidoreductase [Nesterenkonia haasae]|uniref:SgcJ/EcaC family oxidoreductase n=1 Tax=Nesterenkonia haasae TaxID=2587813 RepID=UPI00192EEC13|nr:SgcJ/EcaC family oxidoreductase [Nesterenkonia haasae]
MAHTIPDSMISSVHPDLRERIREISDLDPSAQPSTPEELPNAFAAAWNRHDANSLAALFVEDADFINVVGLWWEDQDSIRSAHDYGFRKIFADSHMTVDHVKVRPLSEESAVIVWEWSLTGQQSPEGSPAARRRGLFTFVVLQQEGRWRTVTAQNTDRVTGAETNINREGEVQPKTYQQPFRMPPN